MAKGINSSVKAKVNSAYGAGATFATTGMYEIPFTAERFKKVVERDKSNNIVSGRSYSSRFTNGKKWVGGLTGDANYTRLDHMIASLMGLPTTSTADATVKTNLYLPITTLPIIDWQVSKGDIPTGKVFQYQGGKGKKFELRWNDRGKVTFDYDCVGYDEVSAASTGTNPASSDVSLSHDLITCGSQMTVKDIGTGSDGAYCIKGGRITIAQKLSEDDYCNGSDTPAEPDIDDFMEVTGEFLVKFVDRAIYEDYVSQTDLVGDIKFLSTVMVPGATPGTTHRSVEFLINKLNYTEDDGGNVLVDKPGLLIAKVGWVAYGTGGSTTSTQPIVVRTVSEISAQAGL